MSPGRDHLCCTRKSASGTMDSYGMKELNVKVFQGVGGSFDVFAGNVKRAPSLF